MDIRSNLPLTETTIFILMSLASRPKHGYAIMKEVETLSDGRVRLSTGTLYGAIKRLLERGWIERVEEDGGAENAGAGQSRSGRIRKSYQLTNLGRRILNAEVSRMETLVIAAKQSTARSQA